VSVLQKFFREVTLKKCKKVILKNLRGAVSD